MLPVAAYEPAEHSTGAVLFGQLKWPGLGVIMKLFKHMYL